MIVPHAKVTIIPTVHQMLRTITRRYINADDRGLLATLEVHIGLMNRASKRTSCRRQKTGAHLDYD